MSVISVIGACRGVWCRKRHLSRRARSTDDSAWTASSRPWSSGCDAGTASRRAASRIRLLAGLQSAGGWRWRGASRPRRARRSSRARTAGTAPASARTTTSTSSFSGSASRARERAREVAAPRPPRPPPARRSAPSVTLTLRSSSASRVCACGRSTGRSATDIIGAVTSRMMTSTSATSMIGVTLTLVMSSSGTAHVPAHVTSRRRRSAPRPALGFVEHAHERAVRDAVAAAHHDVAGRARREQRRERAAGAASRAIGVRFTDQAVGRRRS